MTCSAGKCLKSAAFSPKLKEGCHFILRRLKMNGNGLRKLPIGVQGFQSLRGDGFLYVDKTAYGIYL